MVYVNWITASDNSSLVYNTWPSVKLTCTFSGMLSTEIVTPEVPMPSSLASRLNSPLTIPPGQTTRVRVSGVASTLTCPQSASPASTVTIAVSVATFPFASITVRMTSFVPTLAQVKSVLSINIVSIEQLSVEPLLMSSTVIVAVPLASRAIMVSLLTAIGALSSPTVKLMVRILSQPTELVSV